MPTTRWAQRSKCSLVSGPADLDLPAFLAIAGVEADQMVVRRFHIQPVAVHAKPTIANSAAGVLLIGVVPEFAARSGIECPGVIR